MNTHLHRIVAPHFVAGILFGETKHVGVDPVQRVVKAAPIVAYMRGWTADKVADYCYRKRWELHDLEPIEALSEGRN